MENVVIFGMEKMAHLAFHYFTHDSEFKPVAFTVDRQYLSQNSLFNLPVVPFEDVETLYPPEKYRMFVAIGYKNLNKDRSLKYQEAKAKGYSCVSYTCSKSTMWGDTRIGENCFIFENQVFQPGVKIGNNVIIWSGNHFGHDVVIDDHCFIASHAVLSGNVHVGKHTFIGINAAIRDNVVIGSECIIGAGTTILHDTKNNEVFISKGTEKYPLNSIQFEKMMEISKTKVNIPG